tara:strand:- start:456 stop:695 length:240 start_codon:yes stop_codon:yes gene_type:complete
MEQELYPLLLEHKGRKLILFHNPEDDMLYKFKDFMKQSNLQMFGSFRTLHVTENDLQKASTLSALKKKNPLLKIKSLKR